MFVWLSLSANDMEEDSYCCCVISSRIPTLCTMDGEQDLAIGRDTASESR